MLSLISVGIGAYWPLMQDDIVNRVGLMTSLDFYVGFAAMILVLEATRRAVGLPITIIASAFILYMYYGRLMPGFLATRGYDWDDIVKTMFFTSEGILGTPLYVSATFIFLFLLFGAFLVKTGVGQYFNDLAVSIAGKRVGGPAKVAIFKCAPGDDFWKFGRERCNIRFLYDPDDEKLGYRKEFAGGVEAAASTGGQLMPPIMGLLPS